MAPTNIVRSCLLIVIASGCGVTDFDITQPVIEQRVQGSPLPGPLAVLFPLPLDINISQKIKEMETGPIDSVTLSKLTLKITATAMPSGDSDNWSFVDDIHVFVKSSKSGSTLPRVEIANVHAPGAVTTMSFAVKKEVDLQPYVEEGSVVEGESSGRLPEDDVSYDGEGVFTVHPL
ncbi:MAG TPA: hypothetical protein VIV40_17425 [Kofleriaceae bacterium]